VKLLALLLSLFALPALATTVTCTAPTKSADGSAFAPGTVIKFNLYTGPSPGNLTLLNPTPLSSCSDVLAAPLPPGTCAAVTAVAFVGANNAEGAKSTPVCVPPTAGNATISLSTTSTVAYMLVPGPDTFGVIVVGKVPLSTACDATQLHTIGGVAYYVIPHASVTPTGPITKITAALGRCS
jgi:hypothetical protein